MVRFQENCSLFEICSLSLYEYSSFSLQDIEFLSSFSHAGYIQLIMQDVYFANNIYV